MSHERPDCTKCDGDGWVEVFDADGFVVGPRCCEWCSGEGKQNDSWMARHTDPDVLRER